MFNKKKTCFIITPIGDEKDEIRRHIDGVIDNIITPVMENEYELNVAHRLFNTGSINKQIIEQIYKSDIVIANLTQTNPNVMYELAFRHTLGLPAITIAVDGTKLPFDVISERTIFYKNDIQGVSEAQDELKNYLKQIDYNSGKTTGPIHDYLDSAELNRLISNNTQDQNQTTFEVLELIAKRLEGIENAIPNIKKGIIQEIDSPVKTNKSTDEKNITILQHIYKDLITLMFELTTLEDLQPSTDSFLNKISESNVILDRCIQYIEEMLSIYNRL